MKDAIHTINVLSAALIAAKEHLEYCGYGHSYERDCAMNEGLPDKIEGALTQAHSFVNSLPDSFYCPRCEFEWFSNKHSDNCPSCGYFVVEDNG